MTKGKMSFHTAKCQTRNVSKVIATNKVVCIGKMILGLVEPRQYVLCNPGD